MTAGAIGLFITLFATPAFIWLFRKWRWGQFIRDDGPQSHHTKHGTPTMGGIVIILASVLGYFGGTLFNGQPLTASALLVLFMMVGLGLVGFIDDYIKTHKQRSLGLTGWAKMGGQAVVSISFTWMALSLPDDHGLNPASTRISLFRDMPINLAFADEIKVDGQTAIWAAAIGIILVQVWFYLLTSAASNGVNIADGLDGLAAGSSIMAIGAFAVIGFWKFNQSCFNQDHLTGCYNTRDPLDLAVVAAAIVGALIGFLWWNTAPAHLYMGDTGSLGLGGALAALAITSRTELLLIPIGGIFVIVTGSVILQRIYFKLTKGKRIFLMSPLHHHFELKGWAEVTVVVRFWIIAGLCVLGGIGLFYAEWLKR